MSGRANIALQVAGRTFGNEASEETKFRAEPPDLPMFQELRASLIGASALLALKTHDDLGKEEVWTAYRRDLKLLTACRDEFEQVVRSAVQSSIIGAGRPGADAEVAKTWEALAGLIPPIVKAPLLHLPFTRAEKPAPELLAELKRDFARGVTLLLQSFAYWLQLLVEQDFIGVVTWSDIDPAVGCYHFFRHELAAVVLREEHRTTSTVDATQPAGRQVTYETFHDRTIRRTRFLERHVHHIVNGRIDSLVEYRRRVPYAVAGFLNAAPAWLKRHLTIVSGDITTEEKLRRPVDAEVVEVSEIISTWKGSPAVALGPFALIGWSSDDMAEESTTHFAGQAMGAAASRRWWRNTIIGASLVLLGVTALGLTVGHFVSKMYEAEAAAYAAAIAPYRDRPVYEVDQVTPLILPVKLPAGQQIRYTGMRFNSGDAKAVIFTLFGESAGSRSPKATFSGAIPIAGGPKPEVHGEADLQPDFGLPVKLFVISASKERLRYAIIE